MLEVEPIGQRDGSHKNWPKWQRNRRWLSFTRSRQVRAPSICSVELLSAGRIVSLRDTLFKRDAPLFGHTG